MRNRRQTLPPKSTCTGWKTMRSEIVFDESLKSSCSLDGFAGSLALPGTACQDPKGFASKQLAACDYDRMTRLPRLLKPLLAGLIVTLLQLAMAVGLLAPEAPISDRYSALIQHDSYWFMNIIDRGYQTIVPPIDHKVMEVSNVAFFPAYPAIAALFRYGLNIDTGAALLITAQLAAWGIIPDYLAVFKPSSYRWLVPALNNPTEASQISMTLGAVLLVGIALCELLPAIRRRASLPVRAGIYFCAAAIYYLSVSGVACVDMESMLRYEFCVHALIVLAFLNFIRQFRAPSMLLRAFSIAAVALLSAAGLCVQGWYVWNFTRGNWVA